MTRHWYTIAVHIQRAQSKEKTRWRRVIVKKKKTKKEEEEEQRIDRETEQRQQSNESKHYELNLRK